MSSFAISPHMILTLFTDVSWGGNKFSRKENFHVLLVLSRETHRCSASTQRHSCVFFLLGCLVFSDKSSAQQITCHKLVFILNACTGVLFCCVYINSERLYCSTEWDTEVLSVTMNSVRHVTSLPRWQGSLGVSLRLVVGVIDLQNAFNFLREFQLNKWTMKFKIRW